MAAIQPGKKYDEVHNLAGPTHVQIMLNKVDRAYFMSSMNDVEYRKPMFNLLSRLAEGY